MNRFIALTEDLERGLLEIENSEFSRMEKCSLKIKLCESLVSQLKDLYQKIPDIGREEEIHFFKKVKPGFTIELHYQYAMFDYLKNRPKGSLREKRNYINQELERSSSYLRRYNEFRTYIDTGSEHMDQYFFRQIDYDVKLHYMLEHPFDRDFTSPASPTLTCVKCAEKFIQFLKNELFTLENPKLDPSWEKPKTLPWKGTKTDLVELIYGLHSTKKIDSDLKQIVEGFEMLFNMDIGNIYRIYSDIKTKKEPTAFLNQLETSLLEKVRSEN